MNVALPSQNSLSLCAGYGGIDLGLQLARPTTRTICYVEREATAASILASRFEDGTLDSAPIWSDLRTFDGKPWSGLVDIVTAGYPCQPFSVAGRRRGTNDPRHLWPEVARIIREVEPECVFLENVANHLRLGFREVARELRAMGYLVTAGLFTAEEVGAPHRRQRLFILAYRESSGRGKLRQSSGSGRLIDGGVEALEDTPRLERSGQIGQSGGRRRRVRQTGDVLADAECRRRRESSAIVDSAQRALYSRERKEGASLSGPSSCNLADSEREQREGRPESPRLHRTRASNQIAGRSLLFAPGPNDLAQWRELLAEWPEVEPSICRALDGSLARVDRLRALGNGVVPLVAAFAFQTLSRAFEDVEVSVPLAA